MSGGRTKDAAAERKWVTLPCATRGCVEGQHEWVDDEMDDMCCAITITDSHSGAVPKWAVNGFLNTDTLLWEAWAGEPELGDLEGVEGLIALERLYAAYQTVQTHCDTLNQLNGRHPLPLAPKTADRRAA